MSETTARARASAWTFVPTLYVAQGLPYFVVQAAANQLFTLMGVDLATVGRLTSDLTLPWMLKALWSPLVDAFGTKRAWILATGTCVVVSIGLLCWAALQANFVTWVAIACVLLAISSATNDVATDGYYILALEKREQELYVGARSAAFRLGRVAVLGGAVALAGLAHKPFASGLVRRALDLPRTPALESIGLDVPHAWALAFASCAVFYALATLWHLVSLPRPAGDEPVRRRARDAPPILESIRTYFARPRMVGVVLFILLYRAAESLLTPMISPFLLKPASEGGLGMEADGVAFAYGTVGVLALLAGGIAGGVLIARFGLRRSLWPMALSMHVPNVLYAWAAGARPGPGTMTLVVGVEQLGYGFGFSAYMAALLTISRGSRFSTTHYALSTGLMAFSSWIAGRYSGLLAEELGFRHFFWIVCGTGILGLVTLPLLPTDEKAAPSAAPAG